MERIIQIEFECKTIKHSSKGLKTTRTLIATKHDITMRLCYISITENTATDLQPGQRLLVLTLSLRSCLAGGGCTIRAKSPATPSISASEKYKPSSNKPPKKKGSYGLAPITSPVEAMGPLTVLCFRLIFLVGAMRVRKPSNITLNKRIKKDGQEAESARPVFASFAALKLAGHGLICLDDMALHIHSNGPAIGHRSSQLQSIQTPVY